jgi:hypothetical protein
MAILNFLSPGSSHFDISAISAAPLLPCRPMLKLVSKSLPGFMNPRARMIGQGQRSALLRKDEAE